jgi:hypothetical protein
MKPEEMWQAIDVAEWRNTPCAVARLAIEDDVKAGRAVFFLNNHEDFGCAPYAMELPHLATWRNPENGELVPGVIVQAEHADGKVLVGFRPVSGGNILATLEEFSLLVDTSSLTQERANKTMEPSAVNRAAHCCR